MYGFLVNLENQSNLLWKDCELFIKIKAKKRGKKNGS